MLNNCIVKNILGEMIGIGSFNKIDKKSGLIPVFTIPLISTLAASKSSVTYTFNRDTTGTYIDAYGVIQTAAIDEARFEADGFLIENDATNLFLNSDAPVNQTVTVVSGTQYTIWCNGTGSIALSGAGSGTVTDGTPITITASSTSLTLTITGSLDRVQVEEGSYSTSYIPTTGVAVTRTSDKLSYDVEDVITQGKGSIYCEFIWNGSDTYAYILSLNNMSAEDDIRFYVDGIHNNFEFRLVYNNINQDSYDGDAPVVGQLYKLMIIYEENNVKLYLNGVLINYDQGCTIPYVSQLNIGCKYNGDYGFNGTIKNVKLYKELLSENQAIRMTA